MKKIYGYLLYMLIMFLNITGCGKVNPTDIYEVSTEDVAMEEEDNFDRTGLTWENTRWRKPEEVESTRRLYIDGYREFQWSHPEGEKIGHGRSGNVFYRLEMVELEDDEKEYYIESYDISKETGTVLTLDQESLFAEDEKGEIIDFYVKSHTEFILLMETVEDDIMTGLSAIHINDQGIVQKRVDLYKAFVESEIRSITDLDWWGVMGIYLNSTDDNYYYLGVYNRTAIAVIDQEGKLAYIMKTAAFDNSIGGDYYNMSTLKTVDGSTLFWSTVKSKSTWYTYEEEKGLKQIVEFDGYSTHNSCVLSEDGFCFFIYESKLYRWDIFTGKTIQLFDIAGEAISENSSTVKLSLLETGCPVLYYDKGDLLEIYKLGYQKPNTDNYLTVVSFSNNCKELEAVCAEYTRMNPADGIWVEKPKGDREAYRTRLLADMTEGKGPDAMYVTPEDFQMLYEKGLLEDLTGYLSPELEKEIFKGVLDCGKIDGRQMGYPLVAELTSMLVDESVWDKEAWDLQDIMNLVTSGKMTNLEAIVLLDPLVWNRERLSMGVLEALALRDLNNTPFLNLEEQICSFDGPEFIQLLELCKQYPKTLISAEWDVKAEVDKGSILAYVGDVSTLSNFSETMFRSGEVMQCVGFPAQDGMGSYWNFDYLLVVRKGSGKKETIIKMMESLYGLNNQRKLINPVNRMVFEKCIKEIDDLEGYLTIDKGDMSGTLARRKLDGSTWIPEYLELADKAVPLPHDADMAAQIVREEVKAYFTGNKDAESVAKIIQNRVKLWMMEQI